MISTSQPLATEETVGSPKIYLHITNHVGTQKNMENVFLYLGKSDQLETSSQNCCLYISDVDADELFHRLPISEMEQKYHTLIFSDVIMNARPYLQNMNKHNFNIIIYITNRYHWGIWNNRDKEYFELYSNVSKDNRVTFISDNRYDQFLAKIGNIRFVFDDILRLTPIIDVGSLYSPENNRKMIVYNRGTKIDKYRHLIADISYDVFGENYGKYRDQQHLTEYLGYLHLPYQTNIQSLWENIGFGIIYFIPSKAFISDLILNSDWYYWEEKEKPMVLLLKSIELAEWYQEENEVYFEYFSSWAELQEKYNNYCCSPDKVILKRDAIINSIKKSNVASLEKWKAIISQ